MQNKLFSRFLALAAGTSLSIHVGNFAAAATLKVGDAAPLFQPGEWVQGEPVKQFERDKAYLVDFWGTWCDACRESIPRLNELHEKFKDKGLVVIGLNCWEQDDAQVAPFVKQMGQNMTYRVVLDDKTKQPRGSMAPAWLAAANRAEFPSAFLIDKKGQVAWIGNPMALNDQAIEDVLAGNLALEEAASLNAQKKALKDQISLLVGKGNVAEAEEQLNKVMAQAGPGSKEGLNALVLRANVRARTRRWREASDDLTQALQIDPSDQWTWYLLSSVLAQTGNLAAYQKHNHEMLAQFGHSNNSMIAGRAAAASLVSPSGDTNDLALAAELTAKKPMAWWRQFYLGLGEYRFGHLGKAVELLELGISGIDKVNRVDRPPCEADSYLVLAMARFQMKQTEGARAALAHAREVMATKMPKPDAPDLGAYWWDGVTTRLLLQEAQGLIEQGQK
jgi:thiol-disulfide isomerase/thioredoxin